MGSSTKKKKEKKKDFQKSQLKVGKTKPKPANFTDTSFKTKCTKLDPCPLEFNTETVPDEITAIVLNQQSITIAAPSPAAQFRHHVSLLSSHSASQCRDSLAHITTTIISRPQHEPLPLPFGVLLSFLLPLIYHRSQQVRLQLLKLFKALPKDEVQDGVGKFIMHIRLGMTNIAADIRIDSVETLSWLLDAAGRETVSCPGGWAKLTKCFLAVLGWEEGGINKKWTSEVFKQARSAGQEKVAAKQVQVLGQFLHVGIGPTASAERSIASRTFPLADSEQHVLPQRSNCFSYLNLFGVPRDEDSESYEDRDDRRRWFAGLHPLVERGLNEAKRHGGEAGRAAAAVSTILAAGMAGYESDDDV
ncbi:MAG: hypothetical protein M1838_002050 [Thelocarpon superellum]|nr:MAG: hypothetical protein M1838_002050 [Thelocarpon superellum]